MSDKIRVFAPASIGNVGCGFDTLGLCLEKPGDEIVAWKTEQPGVWINSIHGDEGLLSSDPTKNTAAIAVQAFLDEVKPGGGVAFDLHKKMPFGSGLGSSAASAVAGAFVANELFGRPLLKEELMPMALAGEKFASKSAHADNVAPSLLGGFVLARGEEPFDVVKLPSASDLRMVMVYQKVEIKTSAARQAIPDKVPLKSAVRQWGNVAGLVAGMSLNNFGLVGRSLEDVIVEPHRAKLIPNFDELKKSALTHGALAFNISGSGPACFAVTYNQHKANAIQKAFEDLLVSKGIEYEIFQSAVNEEGAKVI